MSLKVASLPCSCQVMSMMIWLTCLTRCHEFEFLQLLQVSKTGEKEWRSKVSQVDCTRVPFTNTSGHYDPFMNTCSNLPNPGAQHAFHTPCVQEACARKSTRLTQG
jgi:hypothetical protein